MIDEIRIFFFGDRHTRDKLVDIGKIINYNIGGLREGR